MLAAGDKVTMDIGAEGQLKLAVDPATVKTLVENQQLIQADGGQVIMSAKAAGHLAGAVINNGGAIEAHSLTNRNGVIRLEGSRSVSLLGGRHDVSGNENGSTGGQIDVTGQTTTVTNSALDASGDAGGGWQGHEDDIDSSQLTTVDASSTLKANAIDHGGNVEARAGRIWTLAARSIPQLQWRPDAD